MIGLYVLVSMLYIAKEIILPLIYGAILAISISPLVIRLVRIKINRTVSIAGILIVISLILIALVVLLSFKASLFRDALPELSNKFQELLSNLVLWVSNYFSINVERINTWMAALYSDLLQNSNAAIGSTLTTIGGVFVTAILTPIYAFLLLYYQPQLILFIHTLFGFSNNNKVNEILTETRTIIQNYLGGLFIEFGIIAVLNSIGLFILGMDYAFLFGIFGALLNVIPYIGGVIAVALYIVIALVTKTPIYILYVIILYAFIQLVDNNYIVPKIIGSKVKLNALVSIIVVIAGATLWGIPGMFLSIPLTAIMKLIFDRIESIKHWGELMGNLKPH